MTAALTPEQSYLATVAELNTLAERAKYVTHEDVLRIASMSADELRRRAIVALDWHSCFSHCLDGMPELKAIPGGAPDGCWLPRAVRGVVEALLRRSDLTFEDTSHGRRKSPSPEAQRIEALEAELAALRDSECDKIMAMSETQINALTRIQGSSPEDIAQLGRMTARAAIKDVEINRLRAELAACKRDAELVRSLLWDAHPECCGCPVVGTEYMGAREMVCCGEPSMDTLNDKQIVNTLRAEFPAIDAAMAAGEKA